MKPDDIRDFLCNAFPELASAERHNPVGWSFFYKRRKPGNRIITVTQSSATADTRMLLAISNRRGTKRGYFPFHEGKERFRQIVAEEIKLYLKLVARASHVQ